MLNIAVVLMDSIFLMRLGHLFLTAVCLRRSDERVFAKDTGRLNHSDGLYRIKRHQLMT